MPRKRTKKSSFIKQRKAIATRLIQISLIMDDYVYKHKEISECDASSYILEISSLKRKCNDDPRSLQVIEKLTHCMKSIVNEHRKRRENVSYELNNKTVTSKADYGCGTSPKKNIVKKYFTKENNAGSMEANECSEVDSCNVNNNKCYQETYKNPTDSIRNELASDLIVVSSEDEGTCCPENALNDQNNLSQDLFYPHTQDENNTFGIDNSHATLTDLTSENHQLQNSNADTSNYTQLDCSQSILSENDFIENGNSLNLPTQIENTPASESTTCLRNNIENYFAINLLPKNKVDYPKIHKLNEKEHLALVNSTTNKISDLKLDNFDVQVNPVLYPTANVIDKGKDNTTKTKKAPRKRKVNTNSQESVKNKEVQRKPRKKSDVSKPKKDKLIKDKNINLINESSMDLSWIENIKYVREISVAENHTRTKDLSYNFWENYSLPIDWDDSEFEYNTISNAGT